MNVKNNAACTKQITITEINHRFTVITIHVIGTF